MNRRHGHHLQTSIPEMDMDDIGIVRQFEPEYSQSIYAEMLIDELVIGNYLNIKNLSILSISSHQRTKAIMLMSHMNEAMGFKADTLYVSASIMDKYLINLSSRNKKAPCLVTLAITCVMIAAKLESSDHVSFSRMSKFLDKHHGIKIFRKSFRQLEKEVLTVLDFSVVYVSPIAFLERYERIFDVDMKADKEANEISIEAQKLCLLMLE